jgi:hypothetical protein
MHAHCVRAGANANAMIPLAAFSSKITHSIMIRLAKSRSRSKGRMRANWRFEASGRRGWKGWKLRWATSMSRPGSRGKGNMDVLCVVCDDDAEADTQTRPCLPRKQTANSTGLAWYLDSGQGFAIAVACAQRFPPRACFVLPWGHVR